MLKCRDVSHHASDYIDHNTNLWLRAKIVLHLLGCKCCRKFMAHLRLTKILTRKMLKPKKDVNAELVLQNLKNKLGR